MIPAQIIEDIRQKADIVKVINEYVPLKKRGKNYLGLCPFHSEKDASFTVSPDKQIFHCFGCNEGGNVFAFLMKTENISFLEAVEELGAKFGVSVPKSSYRGPSRDDKDKLYQILILAAKYFHHNLLSETGLDARNYLKKRNISEKTAERFGLGYAPADWDRLFQFLIKKGVAPQDIERAGLAIPRSGNNGYYDRFRNRLIFPVFDQRGRVLAFGGRSLANEEPKYLNSPDTLVYHKSDTIFGLSLAKDTIKKSKVAILVEGNFDMITPFQAGFTNTVATMGTALTNAQAKLLDRFCETVILAYDADSAGSVAAEKSIELLKTKGLKIKVAQITGGKDPDDIINNKGQAAFAQIIDQALPYIEFKIKVSLKRFNLSEIESRSRALKAIAQLLAEEPDSYIQKEYVKLVAPILKTDQETILAEIKSTKHYKRPTYQNLRRVTEKPSSKVEKAENNLLALAIQNPNIFKRLMEELKAGDFVLPKSHEIAEVLFATNFSEGTDLVHFLLNNLPNQETKTFVSGLLLKIDLPDSKSQTDIVNDCLKVISDNKIEKKVAALKLALSEAEKAGEAQKVLELLSAIKSEIS